jgi:biotin carboxyl carrier protein
MSETLELGAERDGARVRLLSPEVGVLTTSFARGALLSPGAEVGVLVQLGARRRLVVPAGVEGRVTSEPPERVHHPVGWGDVVCELEAVRAGAAPAEGRAATAPAAAGGLVLRAAQSGRFWHRPAPGEPPFVAPGARVREGEPVALLEVMKTFSHVPFRAAGGLPPVARVVALLAADGADVRPGDALLRVEPAEDAR